MTSKGRRKKQSPITKPPTTNRLTGPRSAIRFVEKALRDVWFYVAMTITLYGVYNTYFSFELLVQVARTSNDNPLETFYTLSNQSVWTLYNVGMKCEIWDGPKHVATLSDISSIAQTNSPIGGSPNIDILAKGKTATRDCATGGNFVHFEGLHNDSLRIDLVISYDWMGGFKRSTDIHHYDTRRFQGRIILVPDEEAPLPNSH